MRPKFSDIISISKIPRRSIHGVFTLFHAHRDGSPVLKEDATWKDINGFMIQIKGYRIIIIFRRWAFND